MSDQTAVLQLMAKVKETEAARAEARKVHDAARQKMEDLSAMQRDAARAMTEKFKPLHAEAHAAHEKALADLRQKTAEAEAASDALLEATKAA